LQNALQPVINDTGEIFRDPVLPVKNKGDFVQPIQYVRSSKLRILSLRGVAWIAVTLIASAAIAAGESKTAAPDKKTEEPPILIEADQLISNNEEKYAEFIGNVKASQADFSITSDKLRIYYEGDLLSKEEKTNQNDDTLKKIVATGNVKIRSDQYSADTEHAEYDTQTLMIVLTGENSRVFSGKSSVTGSKIVLYRKDGRFKVLGGKKNRVVATIFSGGNAAEAFKVEKPKE
jgi:lipopolysaccharide export system protein LptA